tara:strand:+ start:201 stop:323 length:123 start_codon:yes stop_codon:yes gene_type:complete
MSKKREDVVGVLKNMQWSAKKKKKKIDDFQWTIKGESQGY